MHLCRPGLGHSHTQQVAGSGAAERQARPDHYVWAAALLQRLHPDGEAAPAQGRWAAQHFLRPPQISTWRLPDSFSRLQGCSTFGTFPAISIITHCTRQPYSRAEGKGCAP